ncbi:Uncharacterised protein g7711 [Pycnogonum litorale]
MANNTLTEFYTTTIQSSGNIDIPDYDFPEYLTSEELMELIPITLIYSTILLIGLIGNSLIIFVIARYQRMRSISNIFLASLSAADLLLIVACIPVKLARLYSFTWTMGEVCCKFIYYIQNFSAVCSVLTLTAISIERFCAVIYPMKAKLICTTRNARIVIVSIWILSLLMAIPAIFARIHYEVNGYHYVGYWCVPNWSNRPLWRAYEWYMLFSVLIVPGLIISNSYFIVCVRVWRVIQQRSAMAVAQNDRASTADDFFLTSKKNTNVNTISGNHLDNSSLNEPVNRSSSRGPEYGCLSRRSRSAEENASLKQVIKMLVAVVVLFIVCWTPILITNLLTSYQYLPELNEGYTKPMRTAFHLMAYFNSCINPIVYGFMSKNFRLSFRNAFMMMFPKRRQHHRRYSVSINNATHTTVVSAGKSLGTINV